MLTSLLRHERDFRLLAVGMAKANQPGDWKYECWRCGKLCRNRADFQKHEAAHLPAPPSDLGVKP